jgi:hypothetical protein
LVAASGGSQVHACKIAVSSQSCQGNSVASCIYVLWSFARGDP